MHAVFPTINGANMNLQFVDQIDDDEGDARASLESNEELPVEIGRIETVSTLFRSIFECFRKVSSMIYSQLTISRNMPVLYRQHDKTKLLTFGIPSFPFVPSYLQRGF